MRDLFLIFRHLLNGNANPNVHARWQAKRHGGAATK
jgi:hypothetical protein